MYLSQTNGPGYCRLVGSLGRAMRPFPTNQWVPDYGGDYAFDGDYPFSQNPVLISDPIPISDILGLPNYQNQGTAEPDLFKFMKPSRGSWSRDVDWNRYGTFLDVVNQINNIPKNLESPRENEVSHLHYSGTVQDADVPLFDFHTETIQGIWYAFVPRFDVLDGTAYREFRATDINSDGFYTYEYRGQTLDSPGSNAVPTTDYWTHVHNVCETISNHGGWIAGVHGIGNWESQTDYPNPGWLFVTRNVINKSHKASNWWHFDIQYEWEIRRQEGTNWWKTTFDVHLDFYCWFQPSYGLHSPFDWNSIDSNCFQVTDHSTCSVKESNLLFFDVSYSRYPIDEVSPPVVIDTSVPPFSGTYNIRPFSHPLQSLVGERSRFYYFRIHEFSNRDPNNYHRMIAKRLSLFERDFRAASFYSSSDALHKSIDVLKANHIENVSQLSGIAGLLPDVKSLSRVAAKAAKRDPSAILDAVDILANAILAFRFAQKPTAEDAYELAKTDVRKEITRLLQVRSETMYGQFHYSFSDEEMESIIQLPGRMDFVTRSKIRVHTDLTSLLSTYLTANSMGLMPTLSRLWATVPFSFVVDWFTGMGNRLQKVDDQLLWMGMGVDWCLHSFKWVYYPPQSILDHYGLVSSEDEPFNLTGYSREFSRLMPRLSDARFDYLAPSHGPNPVTVGALVWQFL